MSLEYDAEGARTMPTRPDATPDSFGLTVTVEPQDPPVEDDPPLVEADLLVEDVSIDGMCGVY